MNPMTNVKNIKKLSDQELRRSLKTSWHDQYKGSAWIFVGGLPYDLTEGDIICVFSQFGEVVNINLVRDKGSGKSKGFCFLCYEDQRSTVLAVDNFNGMKLLGRTLRVDHVQDYKAPKDSEKKDAETRLLQEEGCAPSQISKFKKELDVKKEKLDGDDDCLIIEKAPGGVDLESNNKLRKEIKSETKNKKKKKEKKSSKEKEKELDKKKKKKTRRRSSSPSSSSDDSSSESSDSSESSSADSDSSDEKERAKRSKHKQVKKKNSKRHDEESRDSETSASSKRRKLEEKIKALEKALSSVRSGRNRQE